MAVIELSLPAVLRERASLAPNDVAFTFIDYEQDRDGVSETLTWLQLYRRAQNVAQELRDRAATGDRAVILAPPGLDYIAGFLGALQAGLVAVPLSVPQGGATDERVSSVMRDAAPTVILTTSAVVDNIAEYLQPGPGESAQSVVEVDLLDLDARKGAGTNRDNWPNTAYLQYTSGSTRSPAGVMMSHRNVLANFEQIVADLFSEGVLPPNMSIVSWLPFYHDMGLVLGVFAPILAGMSAVVISPTSFLARPARWLQLLATNSHPLSAAPNFAFELASRKTSDEDMAGLDLGDVHGIINGSERVHPATLQRFADRFARFNFHPKMIRPAYGLAEATLYVATRKPGEPPHVVYFESDKLSAGQAKRCENGGGTPLISYGKPRSPTVRIVDPDTCAECPPGTVGEIWVHGDNVASGYWQKPQDVVRTFAATLVSATPETPEKPWLRTGDLGFFSEGELFTIGRIKDLLIVYGRNHSPDDIEATIQDITGGRCAAIAVPNDGVEKLVTIVEHKKRGDSDEDAMQRLGVVKREVTSAISNSHGLSVSDLVVVAPGSIPITTSGKVRRATCVELYQQDRFARLDG